MTKYGLTGTFTTQGGKADELLEILLEASKAMSEVKGNVLYVVSKDATNPNRIHVYEVWESKENHDNSLNAPGVKEMIQKALPLLDGKPESTELEVAGGVRE